MIKYYNPFCFLFLDRTKANWRANDFKFGPLEIYKYSNCITGKPIVRHDKNNTYAYFSYSFLSKKIRLYIPCADLEVGRGVSLQSSNFFKLTLYIYHKICLRPSWQSQITVRPPPPLPENLFRILACFLYLTCSK